MLNEHKAVDCTERDATASAEPFTVGVKNAIRLSGLGRSDLYKKMAAGEIQWTKVGGRRLIFWASLKARITAGRAA